MIPFGDEMGRHLQTYFWNEPMWFCVLIWLANLMRFCTCKAENVDQSIVDLEYCHVREVIMGIKSTMDFYPSSIGKMQGTSPWENKILLLKIDETVRKCCFEHISLSTSLSSWKIICSFEKCLLTLSSLQLLELFSAIKGTTNDCTQRNIQAIHKNLWGSSQKIFVKVNRFSFVIQKVWK